MAARSVLKLLAFVPRRASRKESEVRTQAGAIAAFSPLCVLQSAAAGRCSWHAMADDAPAEAAPAAAPEEEESEEWVRAALGEVRGVLRDHWSDEVILDFDSVVGVRSDGINSADCGGDCSRDRG